MAENPDRNDETSAGLAPNTGDLRFVKREHPSDSTKDLRILQRWEWSYVDSTHDWYDVHLVEEEDNST